MKNKWVIIIALIIIIGIIAYFIFANTNKNDNNAPWYTQRLSSEQNIQNSEQKNLTETELSHFSTKIIIDDNKRDNNLDISCEKINGTILKKGEEFSFNKVVRKPNS